MIDAALLADLRRLVNTLLLQERLPEWQRDLAAAVPDKAVKDLVNDFRRGPPPAGPTLPAVKVMGAGRVVTAGEEVQRGTGWTEPPKVDQWKPPGLEHMDRMMDQQDAIDRAARIRELAEAAAVQRALKQSVGPKEQEPKAPKDRGDKK